METTLELTPEAAALTEEMKKASFTLNGIKFNPYEHFVDLKGKIYLPVAWRLAWFRAARPKGKIRTEILEHDRELGFILIKAYVDDKEGGESEAYGSCTRVAFKDYIEKAETKAKGRALADLGYGTQFAEELDEDDALADSPLDRGNNKPSATNQRPANNQQQPAANNRTTTSQPATAAPANSAKAALLKQIDELQPSNPRTGKKMNHAEVFAYVFAAQIQQNKVTVAELVRRPELTEEQQLLLHAFIDMVVTQRAEAAKQQQKPAA
jgi:hypothetical protein